MTRRSNEVGYTDKRGQFTENRGVTMDDGLPIQSFPVGPTEPAIPSSGQADTGGGATAATSQD